MRFGAIARLCVRKNNTQFRIPIKQNRSGFRFNNINNSASQNRLVAGSWVVATSLLLPQLYADSNEKSQLDKKYLTFPYYQTFDDVIYWLENYFTLGDPQYVLHALSILRENNQFSDPDKQYYYTGILISLFNKHPNFCPIWATELIKTAETPEQKQMIGIALWASQNDQAKQTLKILAEKDPQFLQLLNTPSVNIFQQLQREVAIGNVKTKMGMLRGMFHISGDVKLIDILIDLTSKHKRETLEKLMDVDSFYAASIARTELITLASTYPNVQEYLEKQKSGKKTKDELDAISGVLDVIYKVNNKK